MAESSHSPNPGRKISLEIVEAAKIAFEPSTSPESRERNIKEFNELIDKTEAWVLVPILNSLIKPNALPTWLREPFLQILSTAPTRSGGVRATIEFIFSVHPSSQLAAVDAQKPQKNGANITHEAIAVATRLLSTVPAALSPSEWFNGLAPQLLRLLDGGDGQDLAKAAAQVVGFGILGKKHTGAPGAPGWIAFVQPLLEQINPSLKMSAGGCSGTITGQGEEVVNLTQNRVLTSADGLSTALKRLHILILSNPSPGLCKRVLRPVLVQLWALTAIPNQGKTISQQYSDPAKNLLQTYLRLFGEAETIHLIIQNMFCSGSARDSVDTWRYRVVEESVIDAVAASSPLVSDTVLDLLEVEARAKELALLVISTRSNDELSSIFLSLLRRWAISVGQSHTDTGITFNDVSNTSTVQGMAEVAILQELMELAPEKLVNHFDQLLDILCEILRGNERSPLGEDIVSIVLSLLNLVVTAANFKVSDVPPEQLRLVKESLDAIGRSRNEEVAGTARNLSLLLKYRDVIEAPSTEMSSAPSTRLVEEKKAYDLAMTYITGGYGNPPPVVSEGLDMLSTLILVGSPVLDINAVSVLLSDLLKDSEDYINLRVIKLCTQLANKHPKSIMRELLDHYLDSRENSGTDIRLRFGEALLQVIERLGETFSGQVAEQAVEILLWIAGRRGHRPKTKTKQAREERLAKLKKANVSHDPDVEDVERVCENEELSEEAKSNNEVLCQILQGWQSKRGSEDVRIRASALSIFGAALEVNISGIGPTHVSNAVDLCIKVLTMETEMEFGILRRAAVLVILSFVRALDQAREAGRSLGFGLTDISREDIQRILAYVADTDNDGLVQQHARDVAESLASWQLSSLLPSTSEANLGLRSLAGLSVNPTTVVRNGSNPRRPRIEEVE